MSTVNKKFGFKRANELRNASQISTDELNELKSISFTEKEGENNNIKKPNENYEDDEYFKNNNNCNKEEKEV